MENISPQEFLKQRFKSPLFLALTISFFASIVLQLIQNIINIVKGPIVYNLSELGQEIPEEMIDAFNQSYVAGFIVSCIISIIILIPSIIIAFGFLKLYFLGMGKKNKPTGFKLIRAYAKFRIILLYIILGFTGAFFVVLLLSLLVLAPLFFFVIFIVFLLLYGIIFGVVMLVLNYYRKIYMLTFNFEKTYYTNKNTSYIFKLVLVLLIINAVLSLNLSVDLI